MTGLRDVLSTNIAAVTEQIRQACENVDRDPSGLRLVAVTKYAEMDWVHGLLELGHVRLGENRPQQLVQRANEISSAGSVATESPQWHLIGTLQRNKVRSVLPFVKMIHSVDSVKLLERIDLISSELELTPRVLLEVNISAEASKHGFDPDGLRNEWDRLQNCRHVRIEGLMTMAPRVSEPDEARPWFRRLRELRDELRDRDGGTLSLPELSMGMSGDFPAAIQEGATLIRIGSRLYEGLHS